MGTYVIARWMVFLCACGVAPSEVTAAAFRVETPTQTKDGHDIDDASPEVLLVVGGRTLSAGTVLGSCSPLERETTPMIQGTCKAHAPTGTAMALGCGGDPHTDELSCVYGVRSNDAIELWRQDVEYTVEDGVPPRLTAHPLARIGALPLDRSARLTVGNVESRDGRR